MKVILVDQVRKLGGLGDIVEVKPGFARNFLIPQGKAKIANKTNIEDFEKIKGKLAQKAQDSTNAAKIMAEQINEKEIIMQMEATEQGALFGSVSAKLIVSAIKTQLEVSINENQVILEKNIREIGTQPISIHLYGQVHATINLTINATNNF